MKGKKQPKDELLRIGANYLCPRCGGRGFLYLADPDVKEKRPKK